MNDYKATSDSQRTRIPHGGPSVSIPANEIKFSRSGIKADAGELLQGIAYGHVLNGHHGTFVRSPAGFVSPPHAHTEDYYAVVIEGVMANGAPDSETLPLPSGSYYFQRGEEIHVTTCLSETDCLFFFVQPGKFVWIPEK
jgi:hypothetical protein